MSRTKSIWFSALTREFATIASVAAIRINVLMLPINIRLAAPAILK